MPVDLKNLHNKEAYLMITSSQDTDMYYATRFWAPDPFIYIATRRKSMMLMSDLEIDRAKKEARVDKVYSISKLKKAVERLINKKSMPDAVDYAAYVLNKEHIKRIIVPSNFPTRYTFDMTDRYRFKLICKKDPFFTERVCKAEDEIRCLKKATADTEEILQAVIEMIRDSKVKKGKLYKNGELLTSERINSFIAISALKKHYAGSTSIFA
jgi:Xaa-Pro aminopeptidase